MNTQPEWATPAMLTWCQYLLDSYVFWLKKELIYRNGTLYDQAERLFNSPFVVASHDQQADPVLNYGNRTALNLWEMDWEQFTKTPSRLTAEPINREERTRMLAQAKKQGYISDYHGIRISSTGKRFSVEQAIIWTIQKPDGVVLGQGATFSAWQFI